MKILIIDDEDVALIRAVTSSGNELTHVEILSDAKSLYLQAAGEGKAFDIIICDNNFPRDADGIDSKNSGIIFYEFLKAENFPGLFIFNTSDSLEVVQDLGFSLEEGKYEKLTTKNNHREIMAFIGAYQRAKAGLGGLANPNPGSEGKE